MFTRPDNNIQPSTLLSSDIDNAELAARLGQNRLRRSGRVVFLDFFATDRMWTFTDISALTGIYSSVDGFTPVTPPGLLKFEADAPLGTAMMNKIIPRVIMNRIGVELTLGLNPVGVLDPPPLEIVLQLIAGGHYGQIRFDFSVTPVEVQYFTGGAWVLITTIPILEFSIFHWHNIKLVIDTTTGTYTRLLVNRETFILGAPLGVSGGVGDWAQVEIWAQAGAVEVRPIYIDSLIVTVDESL